MTRADVERRENEAARLRVTLMRNLVRHELEQLRRLGLA